MSIWRSKSSNKKSDNKQILKTIKADYSTNLSVLKQRDRINTDIFVGNSRTIIQNNESEHQTQTSRTRDLSRSTLRQLPRFFRLHPSLIKKEESTSAFETPTEWDQKLDREFQSLDIDADGYVSIADLQSVLKNFSHVCDSNGIMSRIFDELDRNRDQRISKHEFKLYKNALLDREKRLNRSTFEEKLGSTFAIFDRNQDNYITPHEIRETMHNLGEYIDDNLIDEMMETADTDHDGRISQDEFKKLVIDLHSKK